MYSRSHSVSGRPTAAQQAQLAVLASHAARSRSAPMPPMRKSSVPPPCPERKAELSDETSSTAGGADQGDELAGDSSPGEAVSLLQKQIQHQKRLIQAKARGKEH